MRRILCVTRSFGICLYLQIIERKTSQHSAHKLRGGVYARLGVGEGNVRAKQLPIPNTVHFPKLQQKEGSLPPKTPK
jgi:hypothetical protein